MLNSAHIVGFSLRLSVFASDLLTVSLPLAEKLLLALNYCFTFVKIG